MDINGILQEKATDIVPEPDQSPQALNKYFTNGIASVVAQSNFFAFRSYTPTYHNDTGASQRMHYFINYAEGSLRITDPAEPIPQFRDVDEPMRMAYKRLFAIWLGVNKELLFLPSTSETAAVPGTVITLEERLFLNAPLFIISEVILSIYIISAVLIYLRRPGRYLARMPTSIAVVIALFAASAAVKDLQGTSNMISRERNKFLDELGCTYGYGSYIGGDGGVHVGLRRFLS